MNPLPASIVLLLFAAVAFLFEAFDFRVGVLGAVKWWAVGVALYLLSLAVP